MQCLLRNKMFASQSAHRPTRSQHALLQLSELSSCSRDLQGKYQWYHSKHLDSFRHMHEASARVTTFTVPFLPEITWPSGIMWRKWLPPCASEHALYNSIAKTHRYSEWVFGITDNVIYQGCAGSCLPRILLPIPPITAFLSDAQIAGQVSAKFYHPDRHVTYSPACFVSPIPVHLVKPILVEYTQSLEDYLEVS